MTKSYQRRRDEGGLLLPNHSINDPVDGLDALMARCGSDGLRKLQRIRSSIVKRFISRYILHCNPDHAFVRTGSDQDAEYVRRRSIETGEEIPLRMKGHTVHFDGYHDQARDRDNTKLLVRPGHGLGPKFNCMDRVAGLGEIHTHLKDIMRGKEAYICFFSLGPLDSEFSIPALQITDSAYVAHSEDMLYRDGYELFKRTEFQGEDEFFKFIHSSGQLEGSNSKNLDRRRVYTDLETNTIYSVNTQYGGNTIGPKKLGMRLAIRKASREGWLTEHMFIIGVHGPAGRVSYFTGAFPSACGKTSTSMIEHESLVGDDIAYLREVGGELRGANPERGIFGIIADVNPADDPLIWRALRTPGEAIFGNVLIRNGRPYWLGMGEQLPNAGINHSGRWWEGKTDEDGVLIEPAHRNARYTLRIRDLENMDPNLENPEGVRISGMIFGARDADTWLPVEEAFSWEHGVLTKAAVLESETTSATLGKSGVRAFNPMANLDFLSIPIGDYLEDYLRIGRRLTDPPLIFSANYFLRDERGNYLNSTQDKRVWLKWMELRVHGDVGAIETPTGYAPIYEDLRVLFRQVLERDYTEAEYERQFTIRIRENLKKIDRVVGVYRSEVPGAPEALFEELLRQRDRLLSARKEFGDHVAPRRLESKQFGNIRQLQVGDVEEAAAVQEFSRQSWFG